MIAAVAGVAVSAALWLGFGEKKKPNKEEVAQDDEGEEDKDDKEKKDDKDEDDST